MRDAACFDLHPGPFSVLDDDVIQRTSRRWRPADLCLTRRITVREKNTHIPNPICVHVVTLTIGVCPRNYTGAHRHSFKLLLLVPIVPGPTIVPGLSASGLVPVIPCPAVVELISQVLVP
ncbi:hypothetical protein TH66_20445 [Carbonactinospora thermoautotrophica]|uniref:Uncharacterized protein n=1 Tax=Carbonactinospora thermoautotrophica TaxID=1469144 RepID=A0A132MJ68_9ACTN|nr:hypothetical protein TH66_20445 [Carbonactinospora thermoautotrophica]KWX07911.1 hypothetical protein TR74_17175 [Carbonactinospora thermoautotrophica]